MSVLRLRLEAARECPDCDRLRCYVYLPRYDEPDLANPQPGANYHTIYQCKACRATWTLGDTAGIFDPPAAPAVVAICADEVIDHHEQPDEEPKGP